MRKVLAVAALSALAGCAVHPNPQRVALLNGLVGKSETDLVRAYGVPTRTFETGGSRFLAYNMSRIESYPGDYGFGYGGFRRFGGWGYAGFGPEIVQLNCDTTFELKAGTVKTWSLRGSAC